MIGKITIGKSFNGCLLYCLNDKKQEPGKELIMQNRAEILMFNQCFGNQKELVQQFNEVRQLNPKLSKPVLHVTLSLAPKEQLSKGNLMEICEQCAKEMGFENNQFIAVHHLDTKHQHLHIVANRIGFDKRTLSDSNNYKKISAYCRKMELKYNLQKVLSPRRFLSKEQRLIPRNDNRKMLIKQHIKEALVRSHNYEDFERLMKEKKYEIIKARGVAFIDEKKVYVKGSELGYSLQTIESILARGNKIVLSQAENLKQNSQTNQPSYAYKLSKSQLLPKRNNSLAKDLEKKLSKALDHLLKPEETNMPLPCQLNQQKRKKQKKHLHL